MAYLAFIAAALFLVLGFWPWRELRTLRRVFLVASLAWGLALGATGGYAYWLTHRPKPPTLRRQLFEGIAYQRETRTLPRPMILHVVTIDLDAPGISFLVTPGEYKKDAQMPARTVSGFLQEFKLQVAVNAGFFEPWHDAGPMDYYPRVGDPVGAKGFAASRGLAYSDDLPAYTTLFLGQDNQVSFRQPKGPLFNALSGREVFLKDGELQRDFSVLSQPGDPNPRTILALDRGGRKLILLVVDGRQPNYSEGATLYEMARIVLEHDGWAALHLDGGGSTALVIAGAQGPPEVLNSPIHNGLPGRERPVANHLGVYARPAQQAP